MSDSVAAAASTSVTARFTMLGSSDAAACEGDACFVAPAGTASDAASASDDDEAVLDAPRRRGVSR